jgi:uncharacterized protein YecE (DUF72 family)
MKIGCCGFARARVSYYARFGVVEVQQTFYQPPRPHTLIRWRKEAPAGFEFALKAWQPITHPASSPTWRRLREPPERPEQAGFFRPSAAVEDGWRRTREAAGLLEARIVLFQCPQRFTPEEEHIANMRRFFRSCDRRGLRFAWEPRGNWPEELVAELCRELGLIHCVDPLKARAVTAGIAYFRLHGITGYRYRHSEDDLRRLLDLGAGFDEAYCLFNNLTMFEDAARFKAPAGQTG